MAEEEAAAGAAKGGANFLTRKIGPLPAGVWIGAFALIYWYLQKRNKHTGATQVSQTDPAGNVGSINPATGYVYGSPQDQSASGLNSAIGGTTTGSGGATVGGAYPDNTAWARAAINYLVGLGIDPTGANSAIQQFLASQPLDAQQQADVNQAIQQLGAPPSPPQPGTSPTPIVAPPSPGTIYASNPPSGLTITGKSRSSLDIRWNASVNTTGYTVSWGTTSAATDGSTTVTGTQTSTTINGLAPATLYYVRVQATPAKSGAAFASVQGSTSDTPIGGGHPPVESSGSVFVPAGTPGTGSPSATSGGAGYVPTRTR